MLILFVNKAFNLAIVLVERGISKGNRKDCQKAYALLLGMLKTPTMKHAGESLNVCLDATQLIGHEGVLCLLGKLMSLQPDRDLLMAQDFLQTALVLNPSHCDAKINLARCIMLSKSSAFPERGQTSFSFQEIPAAISQEWRDDISHAEQILKDVLAIYPKNAESLLLLAQLNLTYQEVKFSSVPSFFNCIDRNSKKQWRG